MFEEYGIDSQIGKITGTGTIESMQNFGLFQEYQLQPSFNINDEISRYSPEPTEISTIETGGSTFDTIGNILNLLSKGVDVGAKIYSTVSGKTPSVSYTQPVSSNQKTGTAAVSSPVVSSGLSGLSTGLSNMAKQSVGGIPIMYLAIGGAALIFILMQRR